MLDFNNMGEENTNELYFFALLTPFNITAEVDEIKREFTEKYESSRALKSPPHITIIPPFFANDDFEKSIENKVNVFVKNCEPFNVTLNGFGEFNNKVIFVEIEKNESLQLFYTAFSAFFTGLGFELTSMNKFFHPHVTVAFRDLTKENFEKAWPEFKKREFVGRFSASSIHLLKHKGEKWNVVKEFRFGGSKQ
ncbi:MAG: 2'-5' RNA ligase family protein [Bacteroidia bacterium]|nr:2'-5' RNA ligase family protein [Bacteroidia bacterium]